MSKEIPTVLPLIREGPIVRCVVCMCRWREDGLYMGERDICCDVCFSEKRENILSKKVISILKRKVRETRVLTIALIVLRRTNTRSRLIRCNIERYVT